MSHQSGGLAAAWSGKAATAAAATTKTTVVKTAITAGLVGGTLAGGTLYFPRRNDLRIALERNKEQHANVRTQLDTFDKIMAAKRNGASKVESAINPVQTAADLQITEMIEGGVKELKAECDKFTEM